MQPYHQVDSTSNEGKTYYLGQINPVQMSEHLRRTLGSQSRSGFVSCMCKSVSLVLFQQELSMMSVKSRSSLKSLGALVRKGLIRESGLLCKSQMGCLS